MLVSKLAALIWVTSFLYIQSGTRILPVGARPSEPFIFHHIPLHITHSYVDY